MEIYIKNKIAAIFFAVFAVFSFFFLLPSKSQALTASEIQTQITALQQQLTQLLGTTSTFPPACGEIGFSRNLSLGMSGADVRCLQALLNQSADTRVAATGLGAPGSETSYFGALTQSAVIKFQDKYASTVLAPLGLTAGTGFVGMATRTKLNILLATMTTTPTTPTPPVTPPSSSTVDGITITGREGTIAVSTNPTPANGTRVSEGDDKIPVLGIKVGASGSDISVARVNLEFDTRVYDYLSRIYLYDGNTLLVSSNLDSGTVSRVSSNLYTITLDNFDTPAVVRKDATKVLTVKVDAQTSIPTSRLPVNSSFDLGIRVAANGVRALDQANLNDYGPNNNSTVVRTISMRQAQSTNVSMVITRASSNPVSGNITADSQGDVKDAKLLVFTVKAQDDALTIDEINNVKFTTGTGYLVPDTAYLYDDNNEAIASASPSKSTGLVNFTNLGSDISRNSERSYTIKIDDTVAAAGLDNGKKYVVLVEALNSNSDANFIVQRSDGSELAASRMEGSATSNEMFVYIGSSMFAIKSISTNSTSGTSNTKATISAVFNIGVTAQGGDIYIAKTGAFKVFNSRDDVLPGVAATSVVYARPASVTSLANSYRISEGDSATFAVNAIYVLDGPSGSYNLRVAAIDWGTSDSAASAYESTYMSQDYVSEYKFLQ